MTQLMTTPIDEKWEAFIASLDPKVAKNLKTAATTQLVRYPLISEGLTRQLDGGIAAGRLHMFYGNTSSGKSGLIMESIGKIWQPMGLVCAYVDVEGTYTKEWGARLGIDNEKLILIQSKNSARIEKEIKPLLEAKVDIIVIDSISEIMPDVFVDEKGNLNEQDKRKQTGAHAKAITQLIKGIQYLNENTAVIMISQTTTFLGQTYVQQIPHGGEKAKFASSIIVKLTSSGTEKNQIKGEILRAGLPVESPVGRRVVAYIEKNKLGIQSTSCEYDFYYAGDFVGVDRVGEQVDYALEIGVLEGKGAWIDWPMLEKKFNGRPKLIRELRNDPDLLAALGREIEMAMGGGVVE